MNSDSVTQLETPHRPRTMMCHICNIEYIFNPIEAAKTNCKNALIVHEYINTLETKYCMVCLCQRHLVSIDRRQSKKIFEKIKKINYCTKKYDDEKKFLTLKWLNSFGFLEVGISKKIFSYYDLSIKYTNPVLLRSGFSRFNSFHGYALKVFSIYTYELVQHIESVHDCKICKMSFRSSKELQLHKTHYCAICKCCGIRFKGEIELKVHHDTKKKIKCKHCGKICFGTNCLYQHLNWRCQHRCIECKTIIHGRFYNRDGKSICYDCR